MGRVSDPLHIAINTLLGWKGTGKFFEFSEVQGYEIVLDPKGNGHYIWPEANNLDDANTMMLVIQHMINKSYQVEIKRASPEYHKWVVTFQKSHEVFMDGSHCGEGVHPTSMQMAVYFAALNTLKIKW